MCTFYIIDSEPPLQVIFLSENKFNNMVKENSRFQPQNYMSQYLNVTDILLKSINIKTFKKIPKHYLNINVNDWKRLACKINGHLFQNTHLNFFSLSKIKLFQPTVHEHGQNIFSLWCKTLLVLSPGHLIKTSPYVLQDASVQGCLSPLRTLSLSN